MGFLKKIVSLGTKADKAPRGSISTPRSATSDQLPEVSEPSDSTPTCRLPYSVYAPVNPTICI